MASAAAQAFFDKQSPKDRMAIIDSWGGADLTDEWFANAQAAGSVPAANAAAPSGGTATATDATTGSTPQGMKNTGTSSFADMIRAKAKAEGWSEDFERFSDGQIEAWKPLYDEGAGRFRSENDPTGAATYDKPAECPPGTTFHGSKCVGWDQLPYELGGTGTSGPAGAAGAAAAGGAKPAGYFGQDDPLQRYLTNLMAGGGGTFGGTQTGGQFAGGGVFSQGSGQGGAPLTGAAVAAPVPTANPAATAALTAFAPPPPPPAAPAPAPAPANVFSSVQSALQPLAQQVTAPAIKATAPDAFGVAPGSGSFEDLIDTRRQRKDARMGGNWF